MVKQAGSNGIFAVKISPYPALLKSSASQRFEYLFPLQLIKRRERANQSRHQSGILASGMRLTANNLYHCMGWHQNHEKYLALPLYLDEIFHRRFAVCNICSNLQRGGIPLPIFSEWWLFNDKFSAIDSFVLSSFPGAMFQGMNGLSVKYQVLDLVLGHGDDLFRLAQSKALVSIHDLEAGKGGELTHDNDYSGALDLTEKTAKEAMTPIE